jgi:hypothetical protein
VISLKRYPESSGSSGPHKVTVDAAIGGDVDVRPERQRDRWRRGHRHVRTQAKYSMAPSPAVAGQSHGSAWTEAHRAGRVHCPLATSRVEAMAVTAAAGSGRSCQRRTGRQELCEIEGMLSWR